MTERMDRHAKKLSAGARDIGKRKARYVWQDHCKGLAILLVVLGHLLDHDHVYRGETYVAYLIYGFHMPLFFILSGYTLHVTRSDGSMVNFRKYFRSKAERILLPGVVFTVVEFLYTCVHDYVVWGRQGLVRYLVSFTDLRLRRHTLLMDSKSLIPQYWFFPALFTGFILMWFVTWSAREIASAFDNRRKEIENGITVLFLLTFVLLNSVLKEERVVLPFALREASLALVYIWVGMKAREVRLGQHRMLKGSAALFLCIVTYMTGSFIWLRSGHKIVDFYNSGIDNLPLSYVLGFSGSMIVMFLYRLLDGNRRTISASSPLAYAGRNSMWIYGLHFFFLDLWYWINADIPPLLSRYSVMMKLGVTVIIMGLSLLAGRGIEIMEMQMKIARRRLRRIRRSNNVQKSKKEK